MEPVADIIARVCPCGGDPTGPSHQESLLHRQWLLGKGMTNAPDAVRQDPDRRHLDHRVPPGENYRYRLG